VVMWVMVGVAVVVGLVLLVLVLLLVLDLPGSVAGRCSASNLAVLAASPRRASRSRGSCKKGSRAGGWRGSM
jgi:hypothetical protein